MWGISLKTGFGIPKAFKKQLEDRWQRIYRMAYAWCHDPHLAADLVQETMEKALKKHNQLRDEKSLDSWLFTILANCWRDHCRRNINTVDINEVTLTHNEGPEHGVSEMKIINRVHRAISQLKQEQRQVVTLVDLEGMSYNQVAQVLDIPLGTVMSRLCRARRQLKEQLSDLKEELTGSNYTLRSVK